MKGQLSVEYLIVVGFALLMTIPTVIIFFSQSNSNIESVNNAQAQIVVRKIIDSAEKVYYLGPPSQTRIKATMPAGIENITITNRAIKVTMISSGGQNDIVEGSDVNITGNLSAISGTVYIKIQSIGDTVNITYDNS